MTEPRQSEPNYVKEAFQWQYNVIALGGALAASLVSLNPLPLILAAGMELMYLATVPGMPRFQRLVRARHFEREQKEHSERLKKILYALPLERRQHYDQLEKLCGTIRSNMARLSSASQVFVGQIEARLQGLMAAYVRLANHDTLHVQYLNSASPESVRREIQQLSSRLAKDTPRVREVNEKRVEILAKRLEKFGKIQENRQVIDAQLKAIEDTLELIREQSMTMEHPQELSERLDVVIRDVESTEDAVREMETIFQISPEMESFDAGGSAGHRQRIGN